MMSNNKLQVATFSSSPHLSHPPGSQLEVSSFISRMCQTKKTVSSNLSSNDKATTTKAQFPAGDSEAAYNSWIKSFDLKAWTKEIDALGQKLDSEQGDGTLIAKVYYNSQDWSRERASTSRSHINFFALSTALTADVRHLKKIVMWSNMCAFVGILTMGLNMGWGVRLLSVVGLSTWTFSRWTMIAHHTCHGGYDKVHPDKGRWNRFKFAVGSFWNRLNDW